MLEQLRGQASPRKLTLLAYACLARPVPVPLPAVDRMLEAALCHLGTPAPPDHTPLVNEVLDEHAAVWGSGLPGLCQEAAIGCLDLIDAVIAFPGHVGVRYRALGGREP